MLLERETDVKLMEFFKTHIQLIHMRHKIGGKLDEFWSS
jgi:hypothetical protein